MNALFYPLSRCLPESCDKRKNVMGFVYFFRVSDDKVYGVADEGMFMNATARKAEFDPMRSEQIQPRDRRSKCVEDLLLTF